MSIEPSAAAGSLAGTPLAQSKGVDHDKAAQDATEQARRHEAACQAEEAAGVGQTQKDELASERDADGRQLWHRPMHGGPNPQQPQDDPQAAEDGQFGDPAPRDQAATDSRPQPRTDPNAQTGSQLDLRG